MNYYDALAVETGGAPGGLGGALVRVVGRALHRLGALLRRICMYIHMCVYIYIS